ncbi:hypothetical protein O3P69_018683 [Scylla paramamosain]|uniref:Uncharacterized protein n=1 Tax=Scylla paramamosain TaxID=85552 RepID=A0AAW0SDE9_SCYPA
MVYPTPGTERGEKNAGHHHLRHVNPPPRDRRIIPSGLTWKAHAQARNSANKSGMGLLLISLGAEDRHRA